MPFNVLTDNGYVVFETQKEMDTYVKNIDAEKAKEKKERLKKESEEAAQKEAEEKEKAEKDLWNNTKGA